MIVRRVDAIGIQVSVIDVFYHASDCEQAQREPLMVCQVSGEQELEQNACDDDAELKKHEICRWVVGFEIDENQVVVDAVKSGWDNVPDQY